MLQTIYERAITNLERNIVNASRCQTLEFEGDRLVCSCALFYDSSPTSEPSCEHASNLRSLIRFHHNGYR